KMILKIDPEDISWPFGTNAPGASTDRPSTSAVDRPDDSFGSVNARYSCLKLAYRNGASVYDPAGLGFTIKGNIYSVVGGTGGKVAVDGDVISFSGGRLNGY